MEKYGVQFEGIVPILFNRFTEEAQEEMENRTTGAKKTKDDKIAEAKTKVYRNKDGYIGIPAEAIKKSMLNGCSSAGIKLGRRSAMPYMRAIVHLETDFVSLGVKEPDGIHECTGRIPPKTGARAVIRRPYMDTGWKADFTFYSIDKRITELMIRDSLIEAGLVIGLLDHRPEFGRFKVNRFKKIK